MLKTAPKKLLFELRDAGDLASESRSRMFQLMSENYRRITPEIFQEDLAGKDFAGLLLDEDRRIQGFTTLALFPLEFHGESINVVFSGDTIIAPEYWGTQELVRGFCHTVGGMLARSAGRRLFWLLISKGHRTYLYLPLFTKLYYPARIQGTGAAAARYAEMAELTDRIARRLFPDSWQPQAGVLRFAHRRGELSEELARSTYEKRSNQHVAFFLERNPYFYKGEELVCLTELSPENLKSVARRNLVAGMRDESVDGQ